MSLEEIILSEEKELNETEQKLISEIDGSIDLFTQCMTTMVDSRRKLVECSQECQRSRELLTSTRDGMTTQQLRLLYEIRRRQRLSQLASILNALKRIEKCLATTDVSEIPVAYKTAQELIDTLPYGLLCKQDLIKSLHLMRSKMAMGERRSPIPPSSFLKGLLRLGGK
jgi:hypothetical protein